MLKVVPACGAVLLIAATGYGLCAPAAAKELQAGVQTTLRSTSGIDDYPKLVRVVNPEGIVGSRTLAFGQECSVDRNNIITIIGADGDDVLVSYDGGRNFSDRGCPKGTLFFRDKSAVAALLKMDADNEAELTRPERLRLKMVQDERQLNARVKRIRGY